MIAEGPNGYYLPHIEYYSRNGTRPIGYAHNTLTCITSYKRQRGTEIRATKF